jgi:ribokinase
MAISFGKSPEPHRTGVGLCVVGNLTIDVILRGVTAMPEWGQEAVCHDRTESVAGQAGTVAFAASAMGIVTDVVSAVGDDASGARILDELSGSGVNVDAVAVAPGGTTPMTVALVRRDGERAFVSDLGILPGIDVVASATKWVAARPAGVVALVGTSNLPNLDREAAVELFRVARREGALTVFDPGWDPHGWPKETIAHVNTILTETDLFLPNLDEARALTGKEKIAHVLETFTSLCTGLTVLKAGESGSYVVDGGQVLNVQAVATSVDNTVGAGDVYDSAVITGFLNGLDLVASMALGSAAASLYVGRRADRFPKYGRLVKLAQAVVIDVISN